ncbi:glycosyltransferase [Demequina sp. SYSU T00192]|uniref:Glycosyltransferase n=1 Tax=Demequina litoralis TaxID=3051660 RepID=A0ABT8G8F6_9MICO|nr:glycosyltransferase [Demequina sp. SYSU T00192]MDN4475420.1 glycosyltransferase [Demequina sp. SYSU T00192]
MVESGTREVHVGRDDSFDHLVITRFSVKMDDIDGPADRERWLHERMELLRKYPLPSLQRQTSMNYTWVLLLDEDNPDWCRKELAELEGQNDFLRVHYISAPFTPEVCSAVVAHYSKGNALITTRLDSDDALAENYIDEVQARFDSQELCVVNFLHGIQVSDGKVYRRDYPLNPFVSLYEMNFAGLPPKTVFMDQHPRLGAHAQVVDVETSEAMWMQVVHGGNVANRVVGWRLGAGAMLPQFPPFYTSDSGLVGIVRDRLAYLAARGGRGVRRAANLVSSWPQIRKYRRDRRCGRYYPSKRSSNSGGCRAAHQTGSSQMRL